MKKTRPFLRRPGVPGCVKTRLSQGRAELFSQLPSPNRSCQCNRFSTTTKSRRKFYAQVQRRSFHTAWTQTGRNSTPPRASVAGSLQSEKLEMAAQKEVAAQFFSGQALLARWLSSSKPI